MRRGKKMLCRVIPVLAIAVILMALVAPAIAGYYPQSIDEAYGGYGSDIRQETSPFGDMDTTTVALIIAVVLLFIAFLLLLREKRKTEEISAQHRQNRSARK